LKEIFGKGNIPAKILIAILLVLSLFPLKYRFQHPEMTETQLLLHFFDAYRGYF